jgi:hypothetical protein
MALLLAVFGCSKGAPLVPPQARPGAALLKAQALAPLPLGSIVPRGWLLAQLRLQASGLTGRLEDIWPDVGSNSGWLGGNGESWERGPYYLDGLLPLAWVLQDEGLKARAGKWVDWTLDHQDENGRLGAKSNLDWWPQMIMLKVLAQFYEATQDRRVLPAMKKFIAYHLREADRNPLREWAHFRWQDEVDVLGWYFQRTGDANARKLAEALKKQGYDWKEHFRSFPMDKVVWGRPDGWLRAHGVNIAMGLKAGASCWRLGLEREGNLQSKAALDRVMKLHGQPHGGFSSDENLSGTDPWRGAETCAIVEQMYSLEEMLADSGDPGLADGLERLAFNALPACLSADFTSRQYVQQANQVYANTAERPWTVCKTEANMFTLEGEWGCCTANFHQGWPKFTSRLWAATQDNGLAVLSCAPAQIRAVLPSGVTVACEVEGGYPFRERTLIRVSPSAQAEFPLSLRVPMWAEGAEVKVNGKPGPKAMAGQFCVIKRIWNAGDEVEVLFPLKPRLEASAGGTVVLAGPLLFAFSPGEDWRKVKSNAEFGDWEVWPRKGWNYGLVLEQGKSEASIYKEERAMDISRPMFSLDGVPLVLKVKGRQVPQWTLKDNSAGPLPVSSVESREPLEELTLVPYGAARLRICVFPLGAR